jgi:hypothetical protein
MIESHYYCGDLVRRKDRMVRVFLCIDRRDIYLINTLPKWFEQTYPHLQIVIFDGSSQFASIAEVCARQHKSLKEVKSIDEVASCDADCVYLKQKEDWTNHLYHPFYRKVYDFTAKLPATGLPQDTLCIVADQYHLPLPYFCEMAVIASQPGLVQSSQWCYFGSLKDFPEGLEDGKHFSEYAMSLIDNRFSGAPKCTVYIPCMGRESNVKETLPMWVNQKYLNKQMVVIDYSSKGPLKDIVRSVAEQSHLTFAEYQEGQPADADIMLITVPNMTHFNISHAYNYAISRIPTDIICTVCADSCPRDYYLDLVASLVDDKTLVQCWWGLHTITYDNWKKLNGHQEFIVGWGAEDDDFRYRAEIMGLKVRKIPDCLVFQIPQSLAEKGVNRLVTDVSISASINARRFLNYSAVHGPTANYGEQIGRECPIEFKDSVPGILEIVFCEFKSVKEEPPETVKATGLVYYKVIKDPVSEWGHPITWQKYGDVKRQTRYPLFKDAEEEVNQQLLRFMKHETC